MRQLCFVSCSFIKLALDFGADQPAVDKMHGEIDDKSSSLIKCEECGIMCAGKSHYDVHIRSHTGERPYICKICGFGFTQKVKKTHPRLIITNLSMLTNV